MKQIFKSFNFRGALNAEHYQVHGDLLNAIPEELASSLNLADIPQVRTHSYVPSLLRSFRRCTQRLYVSW